MLALICDIKKDILLYIPKDTLKHLQHKSKWQWCTYQHVVMMLQLFVLCRDVEGKSEEKKPTQGGKSHWHKLTKNSGGRPGVCVCVKTMESSFHTEQTERMGEVEGKAKEM